MYLNMKAMYLNFSGLPRYFISTVKNCWDYKTSKFFFFRDAPIQCLASSPGNVNLNCLIFEMLYLLLSSKATYTLSKHKSAAKKLRTVGYF